MKFAMKFTHEHISSRVGGFNPFELDHFPKDRGEHKKSLKPHTHTTDLISRTSTIQQDDPVIF